MGKILAGLRARDAEGRGSCDCLATQRQGQQPGAAAQLGSWGGAW